MISMCDWFGYEIPYPERYEMIKRAGFDGVLLYWGDEMGNPNFRDCPKLARKAGLVVDNIHAPYKRINSLWLDNAEGAEVEMSFLRYLSDCAELGIPALVMHLSSGITPPPFNDFGLRRVKRIVAEAERLNVSIAFENLRKPEYLFYILDNIHSPNALFCFDSGHHNYICPDWDLLGRYGSRLAALHLHDNDGTADLHRLPFDGTVNWPNVMRGIHTAGYTGATTLEVSNGGYDGMPPEQFLKIAYERAKRLEDLRID